MKVTEPEGPGWIVGDLDFIDRRRAGRHFDPPAAGPQSLLAEAAVSRCEDGDGLPLGPRQFNRLAGEQRDRLAIGVDQAAEHEDVVIRTDLEAVRGWYEIAARRLPGSTFRI